MPSVVQVGVLFPGFSFTDNRICSQPKRGHHTDGPLLKHAGRVGEAPILRRSFRTTLVDTLMKVGARVARRHWSPVGRRIRRHGIRKHGDSRTTASLCQSGWHPSTLNDSALTAASSNVWAWSRSARSDQAQTRDLAEFESSPLFFEHWDSQTRLALERFAGVWGDWQCQCSNVPTFSASALACQ